jgi:cytochrome c biogenesis protein CcdA
VAVGVVLAFAGGVLSLLAPCGALLLPAFFSYTFSARRGALVRMAVYYYLGLVTLFVPLGLGLTFLLNLIVFQRTLVFTTVGLLIVALGVISIIWPVTLPHLSVRRHEAPRTDAIGIYLLGLTSGLTTGTCTAPILGSILTLAASSRTYTAAALLLLVYAAGMVATLVVLAFFFQAVGSSFGRWWSHWVIRLPQRRGRTEIPGQQIVRGVLVILVGLLFLVTEGSFGLEDVYLRFGLTDLAYRLNVALSQLPVLVWLAVAVIFAVVGGVTALWRRKARSVDRDVDVEAEVAG